MLHKVGATRTAWVRRLPMLAAVGLLTTMTPPPPGTRGLAERTALDQAVVPVSRTIPLGKLPPIEAHRIPLPLQPLRPVLRTWTGRDVVDVRWAARPAFTLPRSPYGDATWNAVTDEIHYDPFPSPSPAYFYGSLHAVAAGTGSGYSAATAAAVDNDIVEIRGPQTSGSATSHVTASRGATAGYVLVRDQATYTGLPAWHMSDRNNAVRVNPATHLANANQWKSSTAHTGAICAFDDSAEGYVFWGIYWVNGRVGSTDNAGLVDTRPGSTPANETKRIVFIHCATDGGWTLATGTRLYGRRGISPTSTGCKILDCDMRGHVSQSTDSNCINTSSGVGQFLVDNCALESASETIMWGGSLSSRGLTTEVCADMRVTRCWAWRRNDWMVASAGPAYSSQKNFWETKNASRYLIDRCAARNYAATGQQYMIIFKSVSQSVPGEPLVVKGEDITVRYCDFDNWKGGCFQFAHNYTSPPHPNATPPDPGKGPAKQVMRLQVYGCRFRNTISLPSESNWAANDFLMTPGPLQSGSGALGIPDARVERNTFMTTNCAIDLGSGYTNALPGLVITDNAWLAHTKYQILASQAGNTDPLGVMSGSTHTFARNLLQAGANYSNWNQTLYRAANFIAPSASPIQYTSEQIITDARYNTAAVDGGPLGIPGAHFLSQIAGVIGTTNYSV